MDEAKTIVGDVPWTHEASYYGKTGSLASTLNCWKRDATSGGIRGPIRLRIPLHLPSWPRPTTNPSISQCLELVALLEVRDGGGWSVANVAREVR